jgi:ArsR family transcriptional regulator, arsenate/arsenite/antimonite-responsive transcriptional repressor / arsenate reductase (thioredoxin)
VSDQLDRARTDRELGVRASRFRALGDQHRLAIVDALRLSDRTPSELAAATGLGSNLLAFHLRTLEEAGLVRRTSSEGDARRRYVQLVAETLDELVGGPTPLAADRVLFVCTRNASRSQLAAAMWTERTGRPADSAGRAPAAEIDPLTVEVAAARGLRLADGGPRGYGEVRSEPDLVVSVCDRAGEAHPPFTAPRLHWSVPDPVGGTRADVDAVADLLARRIDVLARAVGADREVA